MACINSFYGTLCADRMNTSYYLLCAEDQDRTGDPPLFRRMLYQLSYLGIYVIFNERNAGYQNSYLGRTYFKNLRASSMAHPRNEVSGVLDEVAPVSPWTCVYICCICSIYGARKT